MQSERSLAAAMAAFAALPLRGVSIAAVGPMMSEQRTATAPVDRITETSAKMAIALRAKADLAEALRKRHQQHRSVVEAQLRREKNAAAKIEVLIQKAASLPAWVCGTLLHEPDLLDMQQNLARCKERLDDMNALRRSLLKQELVAEHEQRQALEDLQRGECAAAKHSSAPAAAAGRREAREQGGRAGGRGPQPARQRREASVCAALVEPVVAAVKAQLKWRPGRAGLAAALLPALRVLERAASEEADAQAMVGCRLGEDSSIAALRTYFRETVAGHGGKACR